MIVFESAPGAGTKRTEALPIMPQRGWFDDGNGHVGMAAWEWMQVDSPPRSTCSGASRPEGSLSGELESGHFRQLARLARSRSKSVPLSVPSLDSQPKITIISLRRPSKAGRFLACLQASVVG